MLLRIATVTTAAAAAVVLGAGVSGAAPAASTPPPIANTTQTLTTQSGAGTNTYTIDFATTTWMFEGKADSGRFVTTGKKVGLTTNSNADRGCGYSGTYNKASKTYVGQFACQTTGPSGTFTLTTQGAAG